MKAFEWMTLIGAGAAALLIGQTATGQTNQCSTRDDIVQSLNSDFGETRRSVALASDNTMVEVFASDRTGSWSITVTLPTGHTCVVSSGQAYQEINLANLDDMPNT